MSAKRIAKRIAGRWSGLAGVLVLAACRPASLVEVQPPSGVVDPSAVTTAAGGQQLYNQAVARFSYNYGGGDGRSVDGGFLTYVALFTDEAMYVGNNSTLVSGTYDRRNASVDVNGSIVRVGDTEFLHQPRIEARQAREALMLYAPNLPKALQGHLYALEANAILWFAELYCSGIPLSTVSLTGTAVPTAGFTTQELFEHAAALFDSAIALGTDSTRFVNLAKVGKGRALLGLGRFADAATAVQGVPTDFVFATEHSASLSVATNYIGQRGGIQVVDNEGGNGLAWSGDPRVPTGTLPTTGTMRLPAKYNKTSGGTLDVSQSISDNPTRLADGLEARLIEAEADLAATGTNWLTILNTLRSTCVGTSPCAPVPGLTAASLPALVDPGTPAARLDLVMRERAMWLYLTGHRQGDLRRLAHVYHRDIATLWPTGIYSNPGSGSTGPNTGNGLPYGTDVVWMPYGPTSGETFWNPLYHGCFNVDP